MDYTGVDKIISAFSTVGKTQAAPVLVCLAPYRAGICV